MQIYIAVVDVLLSFRELSRNREKKKLTRTRDMLERESARKIMSKTFQ